MRYDIHLSLALVFAGAILWGSSAAAADSALRSVPEVRSAYQQRAAAIAAGDAANVFVGSASVAPRYGFPWMVSLEINGAMRQVGHFCGGVAVAPSWVLTAGHCVMGAVVGDGRSGIDSIEPAKLQVLSGSNVLFQGGKLWLIDRVVMHPEYRINAERVPENDLALLRIAGAPSLTPIGLPPAGSVDDILKDGEKVRIFGWGTSSFQANGAVSNNLLYAFVDVVGRAKCNDAATYAGLVTDSMFCAGLGFADACQGDSGGPAIGYVNGEKYLVGITSWGVGCNDKGYPGVYVNVTKFSAWIRETVGTSN